MVLLLDLLVGGLLLGLSWHVGGELAERRTRRAVARPLADLLGRDELALAQLEPIPARGLERAKAVASTLA